MLSFKSSLYIGLTVFLRSFSFLAIKYASIASGIFIYLFLGLAFIFILLRAFTWQKALKITDLSIAYPFTSFVQVIILIYAAILFDEQIKFNHVLGICVMITGLLFIAKRKSYD